MPTSTVTSKGQTTIPKAIRDHLHLKPHDVLIFLPDGDRVVMQPLRGSILDLKGILKPYHKAGPIDFIDAYNAAVMQARGLQTIYSYDTDFDRLSGIRRLEP